jgi:hypothetical protein
VRAVLSDTFRRSADNYACLRSECRSQLRYNRQGLETNVSYRQRQGTITRSGTFTRGLSVFHQAENDLHRLQPDAAAHRRPECIVTVSTISRKVAPHILPANGAMQPASKHGLTAINYFAECHKSQSPLPRF